MNQQQTLRAMVRGAYDLQKLRIQMGNRIVGNFKVKLGQKPGMSEKELKTFAKKLLKTLRTSYDRITDGVVKRPTRAKFTGDEVISDFTEYCLMAEYVTLMSQETSQFYRLGQVLGGFTLWTEFLEGVRGVGPAMAGVIISEIDIHKSEYPSSIWKYAGLDVAEDGKGRSRRKEHLVEVDYLDKDGKPAKRMSITFNPFLKTKLMGVLAGSFIKTKNERYCKIYYDYKLRRENHAKWGAQNDKEKDDEGHFITSKGRRHNQAMRYMVKCFIQDLYNAWRPLEGLVVAPTYAEAKLGIKHSKEVA